MPNIPSVRINSISNTQLTNRSNRVTASSESVTDNSQPVKRRMERRHRKDRRQKQLPISFERRRPSRRRHTVNSSNSANTINMNDTVGKHINTTA